MPKNSVNIHIRGTLAYPQDQSKITALRTALAALQRNFNHADPEGEGVRIHIDGIQELAAAEAYAELEADSPGSQPSEEAASTRSTPDETPSDHRLCCDRCPGGRTSNRRHRGEG